MFWILCSGFWVLCSMFWVLSAEFLILVLFFGAQYPEKLGEFYERWNLTSKFGVSYSMFEIKILNIEL